MSIIKKLVEMSKRIFQLIYMSQLNDSIVSNVDETFESISKSANFKNEKFNISGMLFYRNGYFIQLLEGQKEFVNELYKRILSDPRHNNIKILSTTNTNKRLYPSWGMSYEHIEIENEHSLLLSYIWDNILFNTANNYSISYVTFLNFFEKHKELKAS
jgi:hypothetical protein